jgi:glycine cleavage system H protein
MEKKYLKTHEWICKNGGIGLSDFAQKEIGDIVFVELPNVGDRVEMNKPFANIESVKAVFELLSPASGEIVWVNEELLNSPELLNQAAETTTIIKIKTENLSPELMDEETYAKSV